jgi:hypothetical protein
MFSPEADRQHEKMILNILSYSENGTGKESQMGTQGKKISWFCHFNRPWPEKLDLCPAFIEERQEVRVLGWVYLKNDIFWPKNKLSFIQTALKEILPISKRIIKK